MRSLCVFEWQSNTDLFAYAFSKLFNVNVHDITTASGGAGGGGASSSAAVRERALLPLMQHALGGDLDGLMELATRLFEGIDPRIGGTLQAIKAGVVSQDKFPLEALRNYFRTTV